MAPLANLIMTSLRYSLTEGGTRLMLGKLYAGPLYPWSVPIVAKRRRRCDFGIINISTMKTLLVVGRRSKAVSLFWSRRLRSPWTWSNPWMKIWVTNPVELPPTQVIPSLSENHGYLISPPRRHYSPPPQKKKSTAPLGFGSVFLLSCLICSKFGDSGDTFSSDFYMGFVDHLVKKFFWMEYASWLPRRMLQVLNDPYLDQKAGFKIRVGWRLYNEEIKHRRFRIRLSLFKVHTRLVNTFVRLFS